MKRKILKAGYAILSRPLSYEHEHRIVAAKALGRPLPRGVIIHHVNEIQQDNRGCNLVIFQNAGEHLRVHRRMRARAACGNVNWRKCSYCKQYDDPKNMWIGGANDKHSWHTECNNRRKRELRAAKKRN